MGNSASLLNKWHLYGMSLINQKFYFHGGTSLFAFKITVCHITVRQHFECMFVCACVYIYIYFF